MAYIVPKENNIMDIHMKKWCGHGKSRLSTVSFSCDPIPTGIPDMSFFDTIEPSSDYVVIPHLNIRTDIEDVWSFVAIG
jgi:hypothetical protein